MACSRSIAHLASGTPADSGVRKRVRREVVAKRSWIMVSAAIAPANSQKSLLAAEIGRLANGEAIPQGVQHGAKHRIGLLRMRAAKVFHQLLKPVARLLNRLCKQFGSGRMHRTLPQGTLVDRSASLPLRGRVRSADQYLARPSWSVRTDTDCDQGSEGAQLRCFRYVGITAHPSA